MKLASTTIPRKKQSNESFFVPIPFKRFEYGEMDKSEYETYTLKNVPTDPNSSTFRINVPYYRGGRGEEYILFRRNVDKIFTGQAVTDVNTKFSIMRRLLQGAALATFNTKAAEYEAEIEEVFVLALNAVRNAAFPKRAISKQKRYMRRHMHKGINVPFKEFLNRVIEMNNYFKEMPPNAPVEDGEEEITPEPMPEDDIMDILEFACPNEWQKQMRLQDFDTSTSTPSDLQDFCENLEELEALEEHNAKGKATKEDKSKKSSRKRTNDSSSSSRNGSSKGEYFCMLHGVNTTHDSNDCTILKNQAKKMRGMYNAQPDERKSKYKKTQELHAIVAASVENALKGLSKKRKAGSVKRDRKKAQMADLNAFEHLEVSSSSGESGSDSSSSDDTSSKDSTDTN